MGYSQNSLSPFARQRIQTIAVGFCWGFAVGILVVVCSAMMLGGKP